MKRCLIFRGGWDGHDPIPTSDLVAERLRANGVEVDIFDNQECLLDPELGKKYDLIVPVWTMGDISREAEGALLKAIREDGVGCGGWHGGMGDAFRNHTNYQFMVGGQWVDHPGGVIDYTVNIVDKENPIVAGIEDFPMHSEQYYMHVDPSNHVLATTTFNGDHAPWIDGTVMPVAWTRMYGKGKIFYSSLGHVFVDFQNSPQIVEILIRGLMWAIR